MQSTFNRAFRKVELLIQENPDITLGESIQYLIKNRRIKNEKRSNKKYKKIYNGSDQGF